MDPAPVVAVGTGKLAADPSALMTAEGRDDRAPRDPGPHVRGADDHLEAWRRPVNEAWRRPASGRGHPLVHGPCLTRHAFTSARQHSGVGGQGDCGGRTDRWVRTE